MCKPGVVEDPYNPSTQEAEAGGYIVQGYPVLWSGTWSEKSQSHSCEVGSVDKAFSVQS